MVSIPLGSSGTTGRSEVVGTGTSPTLSEPAAAKNSDVLFAVAVCAVAGVITRPAGWTPIYVGAQGAFMWDVSWVRRAEVAPALTWGLTGSVYREVYIVCLESLGGTGPILLHTQSASGSVASSTSPPDPPPVTTTVPTSLALCFGVNWAGSNTTWACAGYTVQTANGSADDACLFSKSLVVAAIEDPPIWTTGVITPANDLWNGATVTFTDVPQTGGSYTSAPAFIRTTLPRQQRLED